MLCRVKFAHNEQGFVQAGHCCLSSPTCIKIKGKNKKLATIAVCNKLLKQVFAVVKLGVLYKDDCQKKIA